MKLGSVQDDDQHTQEMKDLDKSERETNYHSHNDAGRTGLEVRVQPRVDTLLRYRTMLQRELESTCSPLMRAQGERRKRRSRDEDGESNPRTS